MIRAIVIKNDMRSDSAFLCVDVPREPYTDGLGRTISTPRLQLPPSIVPYGLAPKLAEELAAVWNAHQEKLQTLEGTKEVYPEKLIWCHPCKDYRVVTEVTELKCPKCGREVVTCELPTYGSASRPPLHADALKGREPVEGVLRFGRFDLCDSFTRWNLLKKLLADGLVYSTEYDGWRQGNVYVLWHAQCDILEPTQEVPRYKLAWQGNRLKLVHYSRSVETSVEPGTFAPDWATYQKKYPDSSLHVLWPDGSWES